MVFICWLNLSIVIQLKRGCTHGVHCYQNIIKNRSNIVDKSHIPQHVFVWTLNRCFNESVYQSIQLQLESKTYLLYEVNT